MKLTDMPQSCGGNCTRVVFSIKRILVQLLDQIGQWNTPLK